MCTKHCAKLPIIGRGIILFIAANFNMFGDCLGVLDSCAGMDFVEQDYQTLQIPHQKFMQLLLEILEITHLLPLI